MKYSAVTDANCSVLFAVCYYQNTMKSIREGYIPLEKDQAVSCEFASISQASVFRLGPLWLAAVCVDSRGGISL